MSSTRQGCLRHVKMPPSVFRVGLNLWPPFFARMMLQTLGAGYVVSDKAGAIRYLTPGRGDVHARFRLDVESIERARKSTARGAKHEPTFHVDIVDDGGTTVAKVEKTLYIRRQRDKAKRAVPAPRRKSAKA